MRRFALALPVLVLVLASVTLIALQSRNTIRRALATFGYEDAASRPGTPDLDGLLSSSKCGSGDGLFVAAYYFARELDGQRLGPLHVSAFDSRSGRWLHAGDLEHRGSVLNVQISRPHVFIDLHGSPSAGTALIFDADTMAFVAALNGYRPRRLGGNEILFRASMRHFAPTHQATLRLFDPRDGNELELFPGPTPSATASRYRRLIATTYAALPGALKEGFETSVYGSVDDFDRSIGEVVESNDKTRLGFAVSYHSSRLGDRIPGVVAIARCQRQQGLQWTCQEDDIRTVAASVGMKVQSRSDGELERAEVEEIVRRFLEMP